jgi:ParB family chromosome partitioning protein
VTKERRLGRGLAALLGDPAGEDSFQPDPVYAPATSDDPPPEQAENVHEQRQQMPAPVAPESPPASGQPGAAPGGILLLNVYEIDDNPFQPRRDFSESEIASLAESLKEHDMLQPIMVRRKGDRHQLISGERRLRAAIQAGWAQVPAQVRDADDRLVAELAIVENLQRKDLNAIEKALSFKRYLEEHQSTQEDLARRIKIDRSTIANLMRLLELPEQVRTALQSGQISAGHARALLPLGDEREQNEFCDKIKADGLSVRDIEQQVQERIEREDTERLSVVSGAEKTGRRRRTRNPQVASLEQELRISLGTKVDIREGNRGRGKIVIHFNGHDEFDRIRDLLGNAAGGQPQEQAG